MKELVFEVKDFITKELLRLGHASIKSTLEIYTHYNKNASQKSIDIMEDILNVDKS